LVIEENHLGRVEGMQKPATRIFQPFSTKEKKMKKGLFFLVLFALVIGINAPLWAEDNTKININTASVEQLAELDKVGVKTAERIVAYREANGPFKAIEELANVKGIGDRILAINQDRMTTGN
jgi:competence protein ComEA